MRVEVRIAGFRQDLERGLAELTGRVAHKISDRVIGRTPVDTGRARDGWVLSGAGCNYTVHNAVPYITALEHGHSAQAPAGMVSVTLCEAPALVERIAREVLP